MRARHCLFIHTISALTGESSPPAAAAATVVAAIGTNASLLSPTPSTSRDSNCHALRWDVVVHSAPRHTAQHSNTHLCATSASYGDVVAYEQQHRLAQMPSTTRTLCRARGFIHICVGMHVTTQRDCAHDTQYTPPNRHYCAAAARAWRPVASSIATA
jgi:hypothetical protein